MRAVLLENVEIQDNRIQLDKNQVHHFNNVLRLKINAQVLVLNGKGLKLLTKLSAISKKEGVLDVLTSELVPRKKSAIDIGMGIVKKDALESSLRSCVELGVNHIYFLKTQNSQLDQINEQRVNTILSMACEQSNNPFLPSFSVVTLAQVLEKDYEMILWGKMTRSDQIPCGKPQKILALIGPEGGFSPEEESLFEERKEALGINLGSYILRTRTAIPAILGFVKGIENLDA